MTECNHKNYITVGINDNIVRDICRTRYCGHSRIVHISIDYHENWVPDWSNDIELPDLRKSLYTMWGSISRIQDVLSVMYDNANDRIPVIYEDYQVKVFETDKLKYKISYDQDVNGDCTFFLNTYDKSESLEHIHKTFNLNI